MKHDTGKKNGQNIFLYKDIYNRLAAKSFFL